MTPLYPKRPLTTQSDPLPEPMYEEALAKLARDLVDSRSLARHRAAVDLGPLRGVAAGFGRSLQPVLDDVRWQAQQTVSAAFREAAAARRGRAPAELAPGFPGATGVELSPARDKSLVARRRHMALPPNWPGIPPALSTR